MPFVRGLRATAMKIIQEPPSDANDRQRLKRRSEQGAMDAVRSAPAGWRKSADKNIVAPHERGRRIRAALRVRVRPTRGARFSISSQRSALMTEIVAASFARGGDSEIGGIQVSVQCADIAQRALTANDDPSSRVEWPPKQNGAGRVAYRLHGLARTAASHRGRYGDRGNRARSGRLSEFCEKIGNEVPISLTI
jgi:hypothetical protein